MSKRRQPAVGAIDAPQGKVVAANHIGQVVLESRGEELPRPREYVRYRAEEFLGRQQNLEEMVKKLGRGERPITFALRGMPGVGKTALASEIAHRLDDEKRFPGGVLWANLRNESPSDVAARWLRGYGLRFSGKEEDLLTRLGNRLAAAPVFIVLDNAQEPASVRKLIFRFSGIVTLITTRKRSALPPGVRSLLLEEMSVDDSFALLASFLDGQRMSTERSVAEDICSLCGHLPLALTIAGAQLENGKRWPSLIKYRDRLEEQALGMVSVGKSPEDSVRVALDVSYEELSQEQRVIFGALSVFKGPDFCVPAIAAMTTYADTAESVILELVDLSLLMESGDGRYRLHDLVKEYSAEKQGMYTAAETRALKYRLVDFYGSYVNQFVERQDLVDLEHQNILGILDELSSDTDFGVRAKLIEIVLGLASYFKDRGLWREAIRHGEWAFALAEDLDLRSKQADLATRIVSWSYYNQGFKDAAKEWAQIGLKLYESLGDEQGRATSIRRLSMAMISAGQFDMAEPLLKEALDTFRKLGVNSKVGDTLTVLGYLERKKGNLEASGRLLDEALSIVRGAHDRKETSMTLYEKGRLATVNGDLEGARALHLESLALDVELGRRPGIAWNNFRLGQLEAQDRNLSKAKEYLSSALQLFDAMGAEDRAQEIRGVLEQREGATYGD